MNEDPNATDPNSGITVNDSLSGIITKDPVIQARLKKIAAEISKDQKNLSEALKGVNEQYAGEIAEGTEKKKLLLEQGQYLRTDKADEGDLSKALTAFIPDNATPNLNAIYFMLRDATHDQNLNVLREAKDVGKDVNILRDEFDAEFGTAFDNYEANQVKAPDFMGAAKNKITEFEAFLYKSGNYDTFVKLKKLKSLTRSENENEARLARTKCMELCLRYDLDYEKLPSL